MQTNRVDMPRNVAMVLQFNSTEGNDKGLRDLLNQGGELVRDQEPNTALWFGLKRIAYEGLKQAPCPNEFAIIDFFADESGRMHHMNGPVPPAVKANNHLVQGGLDQIVKDIKVHDNIVGAPKELTNRMKDIKYVQYIKIRCKEGKEQAMAELLNGGKQIVTGKEPDTIFWMGVQNQEDKREFAILDGFADMAGVDFHAAEPAHVPAAVIPVADELIEGGFENGVLANVKVYEVINKVIS